MKNTIKTITTTTLEIITPALDRYLMRPFTGCHRDFMAIAKRDGDVITVDYHWQRDTAGMFTHHDSETIDLSTFLPRLADDVSDFAKLEVVDNVPQGVMVIPFAGNAQ